MLGTQTSGHSAKLHADPGGEEPDRRTVPQVGPKILSRSVYDGLPVRKKSKRQILETLVLIMVRFE
jgi:hypothetical protein